MARSVETAQEWPQWKRVLKLDHYSEWKEWHWGWPNFSPEELACRHCGALVINEIALDALQVCRRIYNRPMRITSGYRCPEHNADVGGTPNSYHMKGRAFDIDTTGWAEGRTLHFAQCAALAGMKGIGYYDNFIHIDTGPMRWWGDGTTIDAGD